MLNIYKCVEKYSKKFNNDIYSLMRYFSKYIKGFLVHLELNKLILNTFRYRF